MTKQIEQGKAFEYACLLHLYETLSPQQSITIEVNDSYQIARQYYEQLSEERQNSLNLAAQAAFRAILRLEPRLRHADGHEPLVLSLQEDAKGEDGDVRDILCVRQQNGWEIGISCKHNHRAVKHSRLSYQLDFGQKWFAIPCSTAYFEQIKPIFDLLKQKKQQGALWCDLEDKQRDVYIPLMDAFQEELRRLDDAHPETLPAALIKYLIGRKDFYKIIADQSRKISEIQGFNLNGTLNKASKTSKPESSIPRLTLPTSFLKIDYKKSSGNTVHISCDEGWALSFRIHNASSRIESSLKLDIQLLGIPVSFYKQIEPWRSATS